MPSATGSGTGKEKTDVTILQMICLNAVAEIETRIDQSNGRTNQS
jgi:hypothetical protein